VGSYIRWRFACWRFRRSDSRTLSALFKVEDYYSITCVSNVSRTLTGLGWWADFKYATFIPITLLPDPSLLTISVTMDSHAMVMTLLMRKSQQTLAIKDLKFRLSRPSSILRKALFRSPVKKVLPRLLNARAGFQFCLQYSLSCAAS
jgi:hypothetical protein